MVRIKYTGAYKFGAESLKESIVVIVLIFLYDLVSFADSKFSYNPKRKKQNKK